MPTKGSPAKLAAQLALLGECRHGCEQRPPLFMGRNNHLRPASQAQASEYPDGYAGCKPSLMMRCSSGSSMVRPVYFEAVVSTFALAASILSDDLASAEVQSR